jgi:hypothetical protein
MKGFFPFRAKLLFEWGKRERSVVGNGVGVLRIHCKRADHCRTRERRGEEEITVVFNFVSGMTVRKAD